MLGKRKQIVGIYIGQRTIAIADVHVTAAGAMAVDKLAIAETPADAIDIDGISDVNAVSQTIQDLLVSNNIRTRQAALTISSDSVVARLLTLPEMPRNEMLEVLKGEVENYAILTGEQPVLDFQIVDRRAEGIGQKLEMLVVAVSEPLLNSYVAAVETATNLTLVSVEAMPTSILRTLISGQPEEETQSQAMLVGIEENGGIIIGVLNGTIQFIHAIESGSTRLLEDENSLDELVDELGSSLSYCNMKFTGAAEINEITLFMDGEDSSRIRVELESRMGIQITCPQLQDTGNDQVMAHGLSAYAAIGVASRVKTGGSDGSVNLLSPQGDATVGLRKKTSILLSCLIFIMILGIGVSSLLKAKARSIMKNALSVQQSGEIFSLQVYKDLSNIEAEAAQLKEQIAETKAVVGSVKYADWGELIQEIGGMVPRNMWLDEFSWKEEDDLSLNGFALSYDPVFEFRDTLTDSLYFDFVRLAFAKKSEIKDQLFVKFRLLCGIKQGAINVMDGNKHVVSTGLRARD